MDREAPPSWRMYRELDRSGLGGRTQRALSPWERRRPWAEGRRDQEPPPKAMGQRGEHSRSAHLRAHVKSRGNTNTTTTVVVAGAPGRVRVSDGRRRREGWRPLPDRRLSNGNRTRSLNFGDVWFFVNTSAKLKMNVYIDLKFHALF